MADNKDKYYFFQENYKVDQEGKLYFLQPMKNCDGASIEPIANHAPIVDKIQRKTDGFIVEEEVLFKVRRNYKFEQAISIDKKTMIGNQPHVKFSPACRIFPGKGHISLYSDFMQMQCENADIINIYCHSGWITNNDGERVFLNGKNSIDKNGLTTDYIVQLDPDLECYQFYHVDDDIDSCFNSVINGLKAATPDWLHIPFLAYMFLTPLNHLLRQKGKEPNFTLYIVGKTGTYKSSLSKLMLCFFGKINYGDSSPINFEGSQNSISRKLAVGADLPLLLDDRRPTNNSNDRLKYEGIEKYVSSAIGDRAGRGRLNADSTAKVTYIPRSNLIVTAEEAFVNIGSSSIARSVSIEITPDSINFNALQELQESPQHFNKVMQLYIQWVINNYENINDNCNNLLSRFREPFSNSGHARLATAFSQLMFGYSMYLLFLKDYNQITETDVNSMISVSRNIFLEMCDKQNKKVENDKPTVLFIELLLEMIETKRVSVVDLRKFDHNINENVIIPSVSISKNCIGYRDDDYIYLIPQVTYSHIYTFYSESGYTFPAGKASLWKSLSDEGMILTDITKKGITRVDKRKTINGVKGRYIWLLSKYLDNKEGEEDE